MYPEPSRDRFFSNPRTADWSGEMTVCIAGICGDNSIIAVCDMMLSTYDFSADDMALKFRDVHKDWKVMFAGNDVGRVMHVIKQAADALLGQDRCSRTDVEAAMRTAFQHQLIEKQTDS